MKSLLLYTGQVILVSGLLYGYYYFFLRNRQFHQYNRFYLLAVSAASLLIPLFRIPFSLSSSSPATSPGVVHLLETIYTNEPVAVSPVVTSAAENAFDWWPVILLAYILTAAWLFTSMLISLFKIKAIAKLYPKERMGDIQFVHTDEPGTPFSFFNWLFWDEKIPLDSAKGKQIFRHEMFHIRQKHSWDIMFMELMTIFCWINPFFYMIKKELRVIHEFLADEYASKENGECAYAEVLVMHVLKGRQSLVNPFFQNQIKRRIAMITKPKTNSRLYARKLIALPFALLLLGLVAFRIQPVTSPVKDGITVIVDAGHGGFDPGTKSPDNKYVEADMTLDLANTIRKLAPEYGINVVMTRENSEAVGADKKEDLLNRLTRSKTIRPAAFLSLHINSSGKPATYQETRSGFEAFIAAKRKDPQARVLASAMLEKLSAVYAASLQIKQRPDAGIYLLDQNICPSVMLECGYINNQKDTEFFSAEENQEKVARALLSALREQIQK